MNIIKKLTLRHLGKNKSRTVVTTLGICVSVAMITAVFVSIASFMNFYGEVATYANGGWHAEFYNLNIEQVTKLKTNPDIESVGLYRTQGIERIVFHLPEVDGDFYVGDEEHLKQMITCKLDGEVPKNEKEIAVEAEFIEKNGLDWKLGDTVSLSVGELKTSVVGTVYDHDGYSYPDYSVEYVEQGVEQFKLVGILDQNAPTDGYGEILRGMSEEEKLGTVHASVILSHPNSKARVRIDRIKADIEAQDMAYNTDLLDSYFAVSEFGTIATMIVPLGVIILGIIIAASVMLIYNAFGMSLSERTRYLGMLGSVGATKQQKKESVYFEGLILGAISIPLGTLGGILGIAITLKAVGNVIISTGMLAGVEDSSITMKAVVPIWAIVGIVFFSALTIWISAVIPARKASAITPIEALRQNKDIRLKAKRLKTPKYVRAIFGYEGELAHKNLKRNGRKSRVITASIAVSVILFLTVNCFCGLFTQEVDVGVNLPYQLELYAQYEDKDKLVEKLSGIDGVDDVFGMTFMSMRFRSTDERYNKTIQTDDVLTHTYRNLWSSDVYVMVNAIEDEAFNALCAANGIHYTKFYYDGLQGVMMNNLNHKKNGSEVFNENVIGRVLDCYDNELYFSEGGTIEIGALVNYDEDNYVCNLNPHGYISVYVPESAFFAASTETRMYLGVATEKHEEVYEKIDSAEFFEDDAQFIYCSDMVAQFETMNAIAFVIQVFTYGFITLITLVTLANIINTISTGVALRRREFAMLKSVGTTQKGFYKMICLESVLYGVRALVFALPISILLSYAMNQAVGDNRIPFEIDPVMYCAVILAVFVIVGFSMLYSVSKLKKDSIVGTLSEDIS